MFVLQNLIKVFLDSLGPRTNYKIVIFCSDDWGGVRVRSKGARDSIAKVGIDMDGNRFDKFDTLESNIDLERLFNTLIKYKDRDGNHPVLTAVMNVANPDFDKIRASDFTEYFYEPFTKTLERYPAHDKVLEYITQSIESKIFIPESHGREHLQTQWWLKELRHRGEISFVRQAFDYEFFMLEKKYLNESRFRGLGAAFDLADMAEISEQKVIVEDALRLFEDIFGYKSKYFIAPAMHYHTELEPVLQKNFIEWIDVPRIRRMPISAENNKLKVHYLGQSNSFGQRYLVRNCVFETNMENGSDGIDFCLQGIERAFKNNKPAIISNHRASFVSGIDAKNGEQGIMALDKLLAAILRKWPDVIFTSVRDMTSYIKL